ncbi:hypothetical protein K2173_007549 [Erythroxylum novogranatense]|uniref:Thioredoxin domain-containing protein n=1 Tax=Erythroxylum novogranatense TaxID=1862640 RepID=A0AAV8T8I9_9ROSI|nr:hypothetical protein K2173_007549 [Erythroxylum novogranatense]
MATVINFLSKSPTSSLSKVPKISAFCSHGFFLVQFRGKSKTSSTKLETNRVQFITKATATPGTRKLQKQFDEALRLAKDRLVVVEFASSRSYHSSKIYDTEHATALNSCFVLGDESDKTKQLCQREKIGKVPHFSFYKSMEKIHEEEGIGPDQLVSDVLYYGDNHSAVVQLHCREDVEKLINDHIADHKLIVLEGGLKHCGPCVKVYPTVLKLSRQMADTVVFARMNGDENESCLQFLKDMNVIEVPTFLFIRDGEICGRYVGSGKGDLIGEFLRYQGVRVTY